jgi:hypothetical protein
MVEIALTISMYLLAAWMHVLISRTCNKIVTNSKHNRNTDFFIIKIKKYIVLIRH